MIELKHVTKRYGAKCAVDDISFTINKGEVLGFLGRNGAGKSTTMNMITGYISASEGQITLDGMDVLEQPREVKRRIGYLPEQPPLYMDMTVEEYLKFVCDIKEVRKKSQKAHLDDLYNLVKITDVRHRLIKNLSKGYKQRVGLAQALVGNPDVVIMDDTVAKNAAAADQNKDTIKVIDVPLTVEYYAIAMKKGNTELKEKIDKALKELQESGKVDELKNTWKIGEQAE